MTTAAKGPPLSPWGYAVAGAAGAVMANAAVYPLDIIKTKLQVQDKKGSVASGVPHYDSTLDAVQKIFADEGLAGLYAGLGGSLIGTASSNFAYFYWYTIVRDVFLSYRTATGPPSTASELSLGALAGAIAQVFTIPVSVITTRQQTMPRGERKTLLGTAQEVIDSEDGWTGLWRGLKASLVLCVNPAITYGAYQRLKDVMYPGKKSLRPAEAFLLGAMSKALATIATQPLIVAKVGLQSRPPPSRKGKPFKTFPEVMEYIIKNEGVLGLFKGIVPQIMKGVLVQGLLMMSKERIEFIFILFFRWLVTLRSKTVSEVFADTKEGTQVLRQAASARIAEAQQSASATLSSVQNAANEALDKAKTAVPITTK